MTPEMLRMIASYQDRGWLDANRPPLTSLGSRPFRPRSGYLVLASGDMRVPPLSEVQVTTRCYQPFCGKKLIVGSEATRRFDLIDLKVVHRSQFRRAEDLPLRSSSGETTPDLIQWPLEVCRTGDEVSVRAIILAREAGGKDDPGAEFEMLLLGEVP